MANPNRTVAEYRRKNGRPPHVQKAMDESAARRRANDPIWEIMGRVSSGQTTPEEGAAEVKRLLGGKE